MSDEFFKKRISETETDIFPLDRLLPLESVYTIFQQEYAKSEDKNIFFRDRKFQRLREGYFAMFVAVSLQDTSAQKPRYLVFPSDPGNDVYLAYLMSNTETQESVPKFGAYAFDIKEYTNHSPDFKDFAQKSIIPKVDIYNISVTTYRKMDGNDLKILIDHLCAKNLTNRIWILGLPTDADYDNSISQVTIIDKNGIVYDKTINLNDWIDKDKIPIIYQDTIRFK